MNHRRTLAAALLALFAPALFAASSQRVGEPSHFVGSGSCRQCHAAESAAWQASHHAQAMQVADRSSVEGDFSGAQPAGLDGVRRFFRRDGQYFASVGLPGHAPQDLKILYTFGVYPLQQYLVAMPKGRLQALSVAWDSRPAMQGGQHWFSLHPEGVEPGDPLHWTGRDSNWNFMCAACHSTNLRKNYAAATDSYQTAWSDINVACEACHGPGSAHLQWAKAGSPPDSDKGLPISLRANETVRWGFWSAAQRIASLHGSTAAARAQSQVCFPCHSRRQALTDEGAAPGGLLDNYLPQLIEPGVYRADGQIEAEDFEFGSFVQSKMFGQGVTCTNCHDAHSLKLRASGNALCTQCHRAEIFDQPSHSHHRSGSAGAQCVSCHMPTRTYMGVDVRRDHSFRIPRPDLTQAIGTPNACNQCHKDRPAGWAVTAVSAWGHAAHDAHFGLAIDAAWAGAPAPQALLDVLAAAPPASSMVRSSILAALGSTDTPLPESARDAIVAGARDNDALVRLGAARGLAALPAPDALRSGDPLLVDRERAVRIEAARSLAGLTDATTAPAISNHLRSALAELIASERIAADRPESHVNLAQIDMRMQHADEAAAELTAALRIDPGFVPAMVNLADLYRAEGREELVERWLRKAVAVAPRAAEPAHALGLLEVRRGQRQRALVWLHQAVVLDPGTPRYAYVYAVALSESGAQAEAGRIVRSALVHSPRDASLLDLQQQLQRGR